MGAICIRSIGYIHTGPGTKTSVKARLLVAAYISSLPGLFADRTLRARMTPHHRCQMLQAGMGDGSFEASVKRH